MEVKPLQQNHNIFLFVLLCAIKGDILPLVNFYFCVNYTLRCAFEMLTYQEVIERLAGVNDSPDACLVCATEATELKLQFQLHNLQLIKQQEQED